MAQQTSGIFKESKGYYLAEFSSRCATRTRGNTAFARKHSIALGPLQLAKPNGIFPLLPLLLLLLHL